MGQAPSPLRMAHAHGSHPSQDIHVGMLLPPKFPQFSLLLSLKCLYSQRTQSKSHVTFSGPVSQVSFHLDEFLIFPWL